MSLILKKPLAESDLLEIWSYIAEDSPNNADQFLDEIESTLQSLAKSPKIGRERNELAPQLKSFPIKRYVIFYRIIKTGIELIRVLHGARDIGTIFEEKPTGTPRTKQ